MKHLKTKYVKVRVTAEEAALIKEKSAGYTSVTHYVRSALEEYSNVNAKQRLELINDLGQFYRKWQNELSWAGGNLNQAVKRANELAGSRITRTRLYPRGLITCHSGNPRDT